MKKFKRLLFMFAALLALGSVAVLSNNEVREVDADVTQSYPRAGNSGTVFYVNGGGNFQSGQADLAVYFFNSETVNAWSDRVSHRVFNDMMLVTIPYLNDQSMTWANCIVCRYNPALNPSESGFNGVYNQTENISLSSMLYAHNVINITGYNDSKLTYQFATCELFGVKSENHMYLDLSNFTSWEVGDAKFALYFAYPTSNSGSDWSKAYSTSGYYSSFCWKVNGQDNNHLYECIVPNIYNNPNKAHLWTMVIAVRFNPEASEPNWDYKWNQTADLNFTSELNAANMIRITDWNSGELDVANSITQATRVEFYGRYFLDTVACSGTGNSDNTTTDMWNAVKYEYQTHLARLFQGTVWMTAGDVDGSLIAQAMARYDYIVFYKGYTHEDFINRTESSAKTVYDTINVEHNEVNNVTPTILLLVLAISSLSATIIITVIKVKRRHN